MSARIVPSAISLIPQVAHVAAHASAAQDSTGDPGSIPSGEGSYPIIISLPKAGGGTGNVC
jgi:hypothetical protein